MCVMYMHHQRTLSPQQQQQQQKQVNIEALPCLKMTVYLMPCRFHKYLISKTKIMIISECHSYLFTSLALCNFCWYLQSCSYKIKLCNNLILKSFFNILFQCKKKATEIKMWVWFIITTLVVFICYKLSKPKEDKIVLQKPNYKKDIVYLVQFPISPTIRTISPFALKLETYLRLKKVPYECVYSFKFSKKGQIPYIEFNGEQIADSNIIIQELENRGK